MTKHPRVLHHAESAPSTCSLCTTWRFISYGTIEVISLDKSEVPSPSTRMKIIRRSTRNEAHRIQSSTPPVHIKKKRWILELCHHEMVIPKKAQVIKHRASIFSHLELEWMSQGLGGWVTQICFIGFPKHVKGMGSWGPFIPSLFHLYTTPNGRTGTRIVGHNWGELPTMTSSQESVRSWPIRKVGITHTLIYVWFFPTNPPSPENTWCISR